MGFPEERVFEKMRSDQSEPTRVLQIFNSLNKGGAESRTLDIYRHLDREKIQFDFAVLSPYIRGATSVEEHYYYHEIVELGGRVFAIESWHDVGVKGFISQWKKIVESGGYKIAHAHTGWGAGIPLFFMLCNGVTKRIAHARDSGLNLDISCIQQIIFHFVRLCTNIIATDKIYCSKEASDFAFGKGKTNRKHFYFLPNAIDLSRYDDLLTDEGKADIRESVGIDKDDVVIGTVGNARPVKNHIFLVKAFHRFLSRIPNAKLLIIGNDQEDEEAKQYVADHGIDNAVIFLGQRDDVPALLQLMDVFVLPSVKEGSPGVVIEAQAANVPCILSDSITKDVDVGTGLIKYIPLSAPLDVWAQEMADSCRSPRPLRDDTMEKLRSAGYDVSYSCKKLLEIYGIA